MKESIKPPVEVRYQKELAALKAADTAKRPRELAALPPGCPHFYSGKPETSYLSGRNHYHP